MISILTRSSAGAQGMAQCPKSPICPESPIHLVSKRMPRRYAETTWLVCQHNAVVLLCFGGILIIKRSSYDNVYETI